jgi:hypothetical protein
MAAKLALSATVTKLSKQARRSMTELPCSLRLGLPVQMSVNLIVEVELQCGSASKASTDNEITMIGARHLVG